MGGLNVGGQVIGFHKVWTLYQIDWAGGNKPPAFVDLSQKLILL